MPASRIACAAFSTFLAAAVPAPAADFASEIAPLLDRYCLGCHDAETKKGELDLERLDSLASAKADAEIWLKVVEQIEVEEMPPKKKPQLSAGEKARLLGWIDETLDAVALEQAGDPGPVVLRRLNNAEYTYTVRDLTGAAALDPAREFPADGAAGEGFTNTGNSLAMSPALAEKYLAAGKAIAAHAVLLPDGFRFSDSDVKGDWVAEILDDIRQIYAFYTTGSGDASMLNRWSVADPRVLTEGDGRVDLDRYLRVLIAHRAAIQAGDFDAAAAGREAGVNAKYLGILAAMIGQKPGGSPLLDQVRARWAAAPDPGEAAALAAEIRAWQDALFKFNAVGTFGRIRDWQEAVDPLAAEQAFRVKLDGSSDGAAVSLVAATAGDDGAGDAAYWRRPRIERPGREPLLLRDVRAAAAGLERLQRDLAAGAAHHLRAAFAVKAQPKPGAAALAKETGVDEALLQAWLRYLGIGSAGPVEFSGYLVKPVRGIAGNAAANGWELPGVGDISLIANGSAAPLKIPGDLNPHRVCVHPRPERWVAAGWRSPVDGTVAVNAHVHDAHAACGNGVRWSIELRTAAGSRTLAAADIDNGAKPNIDPIGEVAVRKGDAISLIIASRNNDHVCDLTEIDLRLTETGGAMREWGLAADCADTVAAGNPHADRHGNEGVWHFYTGEADAAPPSGTIPAGSLLAAWLKARDAGQAAALADKVGALLRDGAGASEADAALRAQLLDPDGPLLRGVDLARLAGDARAAGDSEFGLDPALFDADGNLAVVAPSALAFKLPAAFAAGAEFVADGALDGAADGASVQFRVSAGAPPSDASLLPGAPVVAKVGGSAEAGIKKAFADFRAHFPAAMCHARIVPVDEVVTLLMYYREDRELVRLMLDDAEAARLDRLWDELEYVSQEPLRLVTGYEQLWQFATQDSDPTKIEPLEPGIRADAEKFAALLAASEPKHLDALVAFAARAYRRPLAAAEAQGLRDLYAALRGQKLPHDEAFRLTLARLFAAPAFLYRLEKPAPGPGSGPVDDWELATRLSYFLWSSLPDEELRAAAARGDLRDPAMLAAQARRMLADDKARRLAVEFACQWLHLRDFDENDEKSAQQFPEFASLRGPMYEEAIQFFADLIQSGGSALSILDADHTFVNAELAAHYGIPGVDGAGWRRVEGVRARGRGGVLGFAAVLAKQSGASRTSPILRGNWLTETLLGEHLPKPPKGVPPLPDEAPPEGLTTRQMVERHVSDPDCAGCHRRVDNYGFALEGYDPIGRRRDTDAGRPVDTATTLPDGTAVDGMAALRDYLARQRQGDFLRQFSRKLLGFALARAVQLSDRPLLDEMVAALEQNEFKIGAAVEKIVQSRQFREIRGE